jgi:hypothetical protein
MSDVTPISNAPNRRWLILGLIGLAQVMVIMSLTVMNIALLSALHFSTADASEWSPPTPWRSAAFSCSGAGSRTCAAGRSRS